MIERQLNFQNSLKEENEALGKDDEYPAMLFKELRSAEFYAEYLENPNPSFREKRFLVEMYREVIAPNDKLYDYLEDHQLTWLDDFPLVNTSIVKVLQN